MAHQRKQVLPYIQLELCTVNSGQSCKYNWDWGVLHTCKVNEKAKHLIAIRKSVVLKGQSATKI